MKTERGADGWPVIIFSNGDRLPIKANMQVRALRDFESSARGRPILLKAGTVCYVTHWGSGSLEIGKLGSGNINFRAYGKEVEEGVDFELGNELPREHWYAPHVKRG